MLDSQRSLAGLPAELDGVVRLVQLPADGLLAVATSREGHWLRFDTAFALGVGGHAAQAHALGLVAALCQRFSQKIFVHLDLAMPARSRKLDISVDPERSLAECFAACECLLQAQDAPAYELPASNILVSVQTATNVHGGVCDAVSEGYDLHFAFVESDAGWQLSIQYLAQQFARDNIERFAHGLAALESAVGRADAPLYQMEVMSPRDRKALTRVLNGGPPATALIPVHRQFAAVAARQPAAIAARFQSETLTYAELRAASDRLAQALFAAGIRRGDVVLVALMPGLHVPIAMLAIFKLGAVYCPLDPTYPAALAQGIATEARPRVCLTQSGLTESWDLSTPKLLVDAHPTSTAPQLPEIDVSPEDPAYLLYTSGTTGKPKGVRATHGNLAHHIRAAREAYGFCATDVFCSLARYTFSISMFELVSPLCCGGSLLVLSRDDVLAPERLSTTLQQVTVVHAGPSLLGSLFRYLQQTFTAQLMFPNVRHVSSGGDLVPPHVLEEMKRVFPRAEVYVIYGCTEISCMGCTFPVSRSEPVTRTYVGRPFPDVHVRVVDAHGQQLPPNVVGEICFAGAGVVPGYLDRPELNAEKFVEREGLRFYHTGDVGRVSADGQLEIMGRRDFQIQLRGIRVELLGIENTVRSLGLARQCAVVLKALDEHDQRLVAFVVEPREPDLTALRRELARHLPDYMVPQNFVTLEAMPLNANGKLDRKRLQELPWQPQASEAKEKPTSALERQIAAAFSRVLGGVQVGLNDDFFELGGHSLLAVMLLQDLENDLGLRLPPGALFAGASVRALAERTQSCLQDEETRPVLLSQSAERPALFMLLGVHLYRNLARALEGAYSVFGVYAGSELALFDRQSELTVEELAHEYVQIIRRHQPNGPYRIGGMSFGGVVAYEVAQQLLEQGEEIAFLGLLDAILPHAGFWGGSARLARLASLPIRQSAALCLRVLGSRLRAALDSGKAAARARFGRHAIEQLATLEDEREQIYDRAAQRYTTRVRKFPGAATLITAGERLREQPLEARDCGFGAYVQALEVRLVDCDHIALVEEPHISEVADIFLRALARSGERRSRNTLSIVPSVVPISS